MQQGDKLPVKNGQPGGETFKYEEPLYIGHEKGKREIQSDDLKTNFYDNDNLKKLIQGGRTGGTTYTGITPQVYRGGAPSKKAKFAYTPSDVTKIERISLTADEILTKVKAQAQTVITNAKSDTGNNNVTWNTTATQ